MDDPEHATPLETRKLQIEIGKLEAELEVLKRRWFWQPAYLSVFVPVIVIGFPVWAAYQNSEYRWQALEAKKEIASLKPERDGLRQQVVSLQSERDTLKPQRDRLAQQVTAMKPEAAELQARIASYHTKIGDWRTQLVDVSTRLKSKAFGGGGIQIFPPPNAEAERKQLQTIIEDMLRSLPP